MVAFIHRLSYAAWRAKIPFFPLLCKMVNRVLFGCVIPYQTKVGKNVLFAYQGLGTVVNKGAVIEDDVAISTCVTIGGRSGQEDLPHICQGAMIGSGAKILGNVRVGRHASIGANAVVLSDVPDYGVAVGVPARLVRINRPDDLPKTRTR